MDWNLRACSRAGHVTYAPTEEHLRHRLEASTPLGAAWRCLRCGTYVLGPPDGTGSAQTAPILLRGKALRAAFILRFLAIERFIRGLLVGLLGLAVLQLKSSRVSIRDVLERDLKVGKPLFDQLGWNASDSGLIHASEKLLNARASTLNLVAGFLMLYGVLQIVEGVGLWMLKRWGEYFAAVATSLFLPVEIYELNEKVTVLRAAAFLLNVAAVLYLLLAKRLFGLRGGYPAYEASLHEESLLEVEHSAEVA